MVGDDPANVVLSPSEYELWIQDLLVLRAVQLSVPLSDGGSGGADASRDASPP